MNSRILDECLDRETIVISVRNRIGKIIASAVSERMAEREREKERELRVLSLQRGCIREVLH